MDRGAGACPLLTFALVPLGGTFATLALLLFGLRDCSDLAQLENLIGRRGGEQVHGPSDDARPPGLVAGPQASAVVAVEVFVELEVIAPVRVLLQLLFSP